MHPIAMPSSPEATSAQLSREQHIAYVLLRLLLGVNLLGHGAIRILHGPWVFAAGMVKLMAETPLPAGLVLAFGYATPFIELLLGAVLVFGVATRWALTCAMLFMTALMFGITLRQDWPTAGLQLGYGFVIFALMYLREQGDVPWLEILRPSTSTLRPPYPRA